jgi:6-phosphogluconate dehydrogenase
MLDEVLDKVVQDDDDTEGTPYWSLLIGIRIFTSTLGAAHYLRIASVTREERLPAVNKLQIPGARPI